MATIERVVSREQLEASLSEKLINKIKTADSKVLQEIRSTYSWLIEKDIILKECFENKNTEISSIILFQKNNTVNITVQRLKKASKLRLRLPA